MLTANIKVCSINVNLRVLVRAVNVNKTTEDGGNTLDFWIIKFHTLTWNCLWISKNLEIIKYFWIIKLPTVIWNNFGTIKNHISIVFKVSWQFVRVWLLLQAPVWPKLEQHVAFHGVPILWSFPFTSNMGQGSHFMGINCSICNVRQKILI